MLFFFSISIYTYIISLLFNHRKRKTENYFVRNKIYLDDAVVILSTIFIYMLLTAFRGLSVGNDTLSYFYQFNNIQLYGIGIHPEIEIGYKYLEFLFGKYISNNYYIFQIFVSLLIYIPMIRLLDRYSNDVSLSCLLFFFILFSFNINASRQAIALSIVFYAFYEFALNGKFLLFFFTIIFAALFHRIAIVAIIFPIFTKINLNKKRVLVILVVSIVLASINAVTESLRRLGLTSKYISLETGISSFFNLSLSIILFILFVLYSKSKKQKDLPSLNQFKIWNFYYWMAIMSLCTSILGFDLEIMPRVTIMFNSFYIFSIPNMMYFVKISRKIRSFIATIFLILFSVYISGKLIFRPEWVTEYSYRFFF
ncbi:MAG: EpsG family protein [Eubacteriales bacterium]